MAILSQPYSYKRIQQAFDSVLVHNSGTELGEEMTRLVVSGAQVDNLDAVVDGKTIAQHEFDGSIRVAGTGEGSVRAPAIDYRKSVAKVGRLNCIANFVNQDFQLDSWSGLWEMMNLERFRNMLFVRGTLLKKEEITLEHLYPGCDIVGGLASKRFRTPGKFVEHVSRVCNTEFVFDSSAWDGILGGICDGECRSVKLEDHHPAFDVMHLIRDGTKLLCFLEQCKAAEVPTNSNTHAPSNNKVTTACDKFVRVMEEMAAAATVQGLSMQFVPVFIDLRKNGKGLQFWHQFWAQKHSSSLHIQATVAGGANSIPHLFPCIAHRFRLLEETESSV
jgi:hypothetical protein